MIAVHALFSVISFTTEKRVLWWEESDLLQERAGNFVLTPSHPSPENLFQITRLIADELFVEVSHKFRNSPAPILTEMFI